MGENTDATWEHSPTSFGWLPHLFYICVFTITFFGLISLKKKIVLLQIERTQSNLKAMWWGGGVEDGVFQQKFSRELLKEFLSYTGQHTGLQKLFNINIHIESLIASFLGEDSLQLVELSSSFPTRAPIFAWLQPGKNLVCWLWYILWKKIGINLHLCIK